MSVFSIERFETISSTNDYAKEMAQQGKRNFCVVAERQTKGRGRSGHTFFSEQKSGLYFSVVVAGENCEMLTVRAAVAVAEAIEFFIGESVGIKWVNDIWIHNRKVCGILAESSVSTDGSHDYAVVGIGINVLHTDFPDELQNIAADLETLTGIAVSKELLLSKILENMSGPYPPDTIDRYRKRCFAIGRNVTVTQGTRIFDATVLDVNPDGSLLLETADGRISLSSGEISIKVEQK